MMPCEMPSAIWNGTVLIFCAMPIAATASEPKEAAKLFSTVMPVTLSRFWIEAGTPTPQTPRTMRTVGRNCRGLMHT